MSKVFRWAAVLLCFALMVGFGACDDQTEEKAAEDTETAAPAAAGSSAAVDEETADVASTVQVGVVGTVLDMQALIRSFEAAQDTYTVELVTYESTTDLNLAIVSGEGPDVLNVYGVPYASYYAKGLFTDLSPLLEEVLASGEPYFENVLYLNQTDQGDVPSVPVSYGIGAMTGSTELLSGRDGWTLETFLEAVSDSSNFYATEPLYYASFFLECNYDVFLDWETGQAHFDGEEFRALLEFLKTCYDYHETATEETDLYARRYEFMESLVSDCYSAWTRWGQEEPLFIGYPSSSSSGVLATTGTQDMELAILSTAENPEGAAVFVTYCLSTEGQTLVSAYPVSQTALESLFEDLIESTKDDDEPATETHLEIIEALIARIDLIERYDAAVIDVVLEEIQPYLLGQRDADTVIDVVQDRISTYLAEQQ